MFTRHIVATTFVVASGCQATAGGQVQASSSGQAEFQANASTQSSGRADDAHVDGQRAAGPLQPIDVDPAEVPPMNDVMLGARAGLRLNKPVNASCQCLAVAVGNPNDSRFSWEGPIPTTNPTVQLVIGLSSEGLACPSAPRDSLGASYQGYEVSGTDVVVQVETARLGRPIVQGAIIPRPTSGGRVLVRAADAKSPYGRNLDGGSPSCPVWTAP